MFHSISILEKDNYKNLKKMLYMWCLSQKWKRKLQHFWTLKKKNYVTHILFMPKMKKKKLQHFWSFLGKKITNIEKKGFHLYVVMGKKSLGEHFDHLLWKLC